MEKTVSEANAKRKFSELLRNVRKGHTYVVTSHGKPVAKLIPAHSDSSRAQAHAALLRRLRAQKLPKGANPRHRWTRDELYERPKSLLQFFRESPLVGLELNFERERDEVRDIER